VEPRAAAPPVAARKPALLEGERMRAGPVADRSLAAERRAADRSLAAEHQAADQTLVHQAADQTLVHQAADQTRAVRRGGRPVADQTLAAPRAEPARQQKEERPPTWCLSVAAGEPLLAARLLAVRRLLGPEAPLLAVRLRLERPASASRASSS